MKTSIRHLVFWPTFLILVAAVTMSAVNKDGFLEAMTTANDWVLANFAWLFSLSGLYMLIVALIVFFSPLGRVRIGGPDAKPLLTKPRWFFITLCTTLAVGILFWTTAEPLYHLMAPPESLGIEPGSPEAAVFSMSTMVIHWSFTPYAIYAVPSLVFALVFYNLRHRFSITSMLVPVFGERIYRYAALIDSLALYSLVVGMASSLGTGALTISGGVGRYTDLGGADIRLGIVIAAIVATFVLSAASGLHRGIARLSSINAWLLLALGVFTLVVGPTAYMLGLGTESLGAALDGFFSRSLFTGTAGNDPWANGWTVFYWAVWFAWAPMAALFLGKISRGHTVRDFLLVNLVWPALFAIVWVWIMGGLAMHRQLQTDDNPYAVLNDQGIETLLYHLFGDLPLGVIWVPMLVFIAFISYVTAADSQTDAIGNLCTKGVTAESDVVSSGLAMKVVWGVVIGSVSWVMVSFVGIDGVKMLSNLGGLPSMLITLVASVSLWKWLVSPQLVVGPRGAPDPVREPGEGGSSVSTPDAEPPVVTSDR